MALLLARLDTKSGAAPATVGLTMLFANHWETGKEEQPRMTASQETGPQQGMHACQSVWDSVGGLQPEMASVSIPSSP